MPNLINLIKQDQQIQESIQNSKEYLSGLAKSLSTDLVGGIGDLVNSVRENVAHSGKLPIGTNDVRAMLNIKPVEQDTVNERLGSLSSIAIAPEKLIPSIAGMLVGPKAIGFDKALAKAAEEAHKAGKKVVGDYRVYPDGNVKKEISDTKLALELKPGFQAIQQMIDTGINTKTGKPLRDFEVDMFKDIVRNQSEYIASHPELEKAYPIISRVMKDMDLKLDSSMTAGGEGSLRDLGKFGMLIEGKARNREELRSVAAHELQHAVQILEKWQSGGNPESIRSSIIFQLEEKALRANKNVPISEIMQKDLAYNLYRKLYGEAEARLVESRLNMSQQLRQITEPEFDVPKASMLLKVK